MGISSAQDIATIQEYYGLSSDWPEMLVADIEAGNIIPGTTLKGMVEVAIDTGVFDSESVELIDLLVNPDCLGEDIIDVVNEAWQTTSEGTELYNDCKAYLEAAGIPTDALNQALQILAENEANQSTDENGEATYQITDAMLEDLYEMAVPMGPIAMSMVTAFQAVSWAGEASEEIGEKFEDLSEEMDDVISDMEDIEFSDDEAANAAANADLSILSSKLSLMQTAYKTLQDCQKTITDISAGSEEMLATQVESRKRLSEFILNKW